MCDFEDFDDGDYMDEDSCEDKFNDEIMDDTDDLDDGLSGDEQESDDFTARDAFFVGSIVGNAYEGSLDERKRRELLKKKRTKRDPPSD